MRLEIRAWSFNPGSLLVKAPKILLNDTGILASLPGLNAPRLLSDGGIPNPPLETLITNELFKAASWTETHLLVPHVRPRTWQEVDLALEGL